MQEADAVVVGAGAMGCAIAYLLSRKGVGVIIAEKDSIASHASGYALGGLSPLTTTSQGLEGFPTRLACESLRLHRSLYRELKKETGIDYHFKSPMPRLALAFTRREVEYLQSWVSEQKSEGLRAGWLDKEAVWAIDGRISRRILGAARCDKGVLDSYKFVLALAQGAEKHGAQIRYTRVTGLEKEHGQYRVRTLTEDFSCRKVVLAMGPWSGEAEAWLHMPVPVGPEKGQEVRLRLAGPPFPYTITWSRYHVETKHDGVIFAGTTKEDAGFDDKPTAESRDDIIKGVLRMVPCMKNADIILQTACLRPVSTDRTPIIGEVPGWPGVYLATGHGGRGMLLSAITAQLVVSSILGSGSNRYLEPFTPARFLKTHVDL
ncbi:MAG: FAD-binding oxidoreductase [Chloroflexi bacterium]|nr:FAD-binding oxidoreductase [Chloroflexota bacterium]